MILAVYYESKLVNVFDQVVEKSLSTQKEIRCSRHNEYLMQVPKNLQVKCTNPNSKKPGGICNNIALFRCPHGLRNTNEPPMCQIGLCSRCVKSVIEKRNAEQRLENSNNSIVISTKHSDFENNDPCSVVSDDGEKSLSSNESIDPELENKLTSNICSSEDESSELDDDSYGFDNVLDYQHDVVDSEIHQTYTSKRTMIYDPNLSIPSKYLLNNHFKVLKRNLP